MIEFVLATLLSGSFATAKEKKPARGPASIDVESKLLGELQRTLETHAAQGEKSSVDEEAILDRPALQANDRPQYREDY